MIIYNVTVSIDAQIAEKWVAYMRETHIPEVMATKCFKESRFCRVHGEEEGGETYATTYVAENQEIFDRYLSEFAPKLRDEFNAKWAGRFAAFRTTLSVIEEFVSK